MICQPPGQATLSSRDLLRFKNFSFENTGTVRGTIRSLLYARDGDLSRDVRGGSCGAGSNMYLQGAELRDEALCPANFIQRKGVQR